MPATLRRDDHDPVVSSQLSSSLLASSPTGARLSSRPLLTNILSINEITSEPEILHFRGGFHHSGWHLSDWRQNYLTILYITAQSSNAPLSTISWIMLFVLILLSICTTAFSQSFTIPSTWKVRVFLHFGFLFLRRSHAEHDRPR